jgi:hypothetical protein
VLPWEERNGGPVKSTTAGLGRGNWAGSIVSREVVGLLDKVEGSCLFACGGDGEKEPVNFRDCNGVRESRQA